MDISAPLAASCRPSAEALHAVEGRRGPPALDTDRASGTGGTRASGSPRTRRSEAPRRGGRPGPSAPRPRPPRRVPPAEPTPSTRCAGPQAPADPTPAQVQRGDRAHLRAAGAPACQTRGASAARGQREGSQSVRPTGSPAPPPAHGRGLRMPRPHRAPLHPAPCTQPPAPRLSGRSRPALPRPSGSAPSFICASFSCPYICL